MRVAVVGATGLVGGVMLEVLAERRFPVTELLPVASENSTGRGINFSGKDWPVITIDEAVAKRPTVALFSAGADLSLQYAPQFANAGTTVIDNSSAWRMHPDIPLVVPEINFTAINPASNKIIANPNCSTIQLVMALWPLQQAYGIKRVVVSTYQSVSGTGKEALAQLNAERQGNANAVKRVYAHTIDKNCLPQCDVFESNGSGYTKEELKVVNESRKIMNLPNLALTCTAVRVPVQIGHSESVNVEFYKPYDLNDVKQILAAMPGVVLQDDPEQQLYPMPINAANKDEVFVGRLRRDESQPNTLNMWVVADNLRKGAATNAVQIAEYLFK